MDLSNLNDNNLKICVVGISNTSEIMIKIRYIGKRVQQDSKAQ